MIPYNCIITPVQLYYYTAQSCYHTLGFVAGGKERTSVCLRLWLASVRTRRVVLTKINNKFGYITFLFHAIT